MQLVMNKFYVQLYPTHFYLKKRDIDNGTPR